MNKQDILDRLENIYKLVEEVKNERMHFDERNEILGEASYLLQRLMNNIR
jgi:hypothetical protein